VCESVTCGRPS